MNDLFEGDPADQDKRVSVNNIIMGKLLESETLKQQAVNNTKEQFANSPDLRNELLNAIIEALEAHTTMSSQALDSEAVRNTLKDILLGPTQLYEALWGQKQRDEAEVKQVNCRDCQTVHINRPRELLKRYRNVCQTFAKRFGNVRQTFR